MRSFRRVFSGHASVVLPLAAKTASIVNALGKGEPLRLPPRVCEDSFWISRRALVHSFAGPSSRRGTGRYRSEARNGGDQGRQQGASRLPELHGKQDFEDAKRGLIDSPPTLTIKNDKGDVVWDLESYKKYIGLDKAAPDTVNPSLWRNAQLNMIYGLFKVTDRVYQVRGYDLSNITFVEGKTGWIVGDPLISAETAKAAYELVTKNLGKKPIVAVIYSHSHVDHYGGVRGLVDEADVKAGKVRIIAPEGFTEESVSENVIAGNAMAPARDLHVRRLAAAQPAGRRQRRARPDDLDRHCDADRADDDHQQDRHRR